MDALAEEKALRISYQDTVYAVCLELDKRLGNSPSKGQATGSSKEEVLAALARCFGHVSAQMRVTDPIDMSQASR